MLVHRTVPSPIGPLTLIADDAALVALHLPNGRHQRAFDSRERLERHPVLDRAARELAEYFDGARTAFTIPLAPEGTPFQQRVWKALLAIPHGRTLSYGELATKAGAPRAIRACGSANGHNPIAIVIPCHRVIGADGLLTGYGGGLPAKRFLLDLESGVSAPRLPEAAARRRTAS